MSWKKTQGKDEKIMFIGDWLKEEFTFSELCDRYTVSRPTGYRLVKRYEEEGEAAFEEKSHARHHHPNETDDEIKRIVIELKHRYQTWGPKKLKNWLELNDVGIDYPAVSTIGDILKKHGLVKCRRYRKKVPPHTQPFAKCEGSNEVWSADFKGQFRLGNGKYCYPLTLTDNFSRYLLVCRGLDHPDTKSSIKWFKKAFEKFGLPEVIKTDNGQPFAGTGIGGLTQLSIWWLKLGILPERIDSGHPEQNGRHERMHRTLKESTAKPPQETQVAQQKSFNAFINEYNFERPHEGLGKKRPADIYVKSKRALPSILPEVSYPDHYLIRKVKTNGGIKWQGKLFYVSELLHGEPIGLEAIDEQRAMVYFSKAKLGIIDARKDKINRLIWNTKV